MEDTIDVCSRCGKMPRSIDLINGFFSCSRCGNNQLIAVKGDAYERVVTELDRKYQENLSKTRLESVEKNPVPGALEKKGKEKKKKLMKKNKKKRR